MWRIRKRLYIYACVCTYNIIRTYVRNTYTRCITLYFVRRSRSRSQSNTRNSRIYRGKCPVFPGSRILRAISIYPHTPYTPPPLTLVTPPSLQPFAFIPPLPPPFRSNPAAWLSLDNTKRILTIRALSLRAAKKK